MLLNKIIVKRLKSYWAQTNSTINWDIIFTILDDEIEILKDRTECGYCMEELNIYWVLCKCGRNVVCENCNECKQCEVEGIDWFNRCKYYDNY